MVSTHATAAFSCALPRAAGDAAAAPAAAAAAAAAAPRLTAALSLARPQFSEDATRVLRDAPARWRLALLSDGHTAPLLSALASAPLSLRLRCVRGATVPRLPRGERFDGDAAVLRVVSLHLPDGAPLLAASSTWSARAYAALLAGRHCHPLHDIFAAHRVAASRAVLAVHFGLCASAAPLLATAATSPAWARDLLFRRRKTTFLLVHEVLAPAAAELVLGPMPVPLHLPNSLSLPPH